MKLIPVECFFETVDPYTVKRYTDYWLDIKPKNTEDVFRRYLFAFLSVHTSWESNVRGYQALKDLAWVNDKADLKQKLIDSRCGMYNGRTENIWNFKKQFYGDLNYYDTTRCKKVKRDWTNYRNALVKKVKGLGIAKISFTLEMCFPNTAKLSCIDTHGIQFYGLDYQNFQTKRGLELYETAEKHWVENSKAVDCSPYMARCIFWDRKQKQTDTRYWSYVLEEN